MGASKHAASTRRTNFEGVTVRESLARRLVTPIEIWHFLKAEFDLCEQWQGWISCDECEADEESDINKWEFGRINRVWLGQGLNLPCQCDKN